MRAETRHQLKQDKFSRATIGAAEATVHWTVEHRNTIIVALVVLGVIAVGSLAGYAYIQKQNDVASLEYGAAMRIYTSALRAKDAPSELRN